MNRLVIAFVFVLILLTGCGFAGPCGNGDPFALFQYCEKRVVYPYGAHWVKEGMTRESRRIDSWSCGAASTVHAADHVVFTNEQRDAVRLFTDKDNYGPDGRLLNQWRVCMQSKGYVYLDKCAARCLYP